VKPSTDRTRDPSEERTPARRARSRPARASRHRALPARPRRSRARHDVARQLAQLLPDPGGRDERFFGRIEVAGAEQNDVPGSDVAGVDQHAQGIPQALPEGELSCVFRSPCASIQTTPTRRADARARAPRRRERQQHPPRTSRFARKLACRRFDLRLERLLGDRGRLRPGRLIPAASAIASPAVAAPPPPRLHPKHADAQEAGRELASAGVALVVGADQRLPSASGSRDTSRGARSIARPRRACVDKLALPGVRLPQARACPRARTAASRRWGFVRVDAESHLAEAARVATT